jgi:hypothetical protein
LPKTAGFEANLAEELELRELTSTHSGESGATRNWAGSDKNSIYMAVVESKFLYGLPVFCMKVAELRRRNGFQIKCLRKKNGIAPFSISRVSNKTVMQHASCKLASAQLLATQLWLLRKVILNRPEHPLRPSCMAGDSLQPIVSSYIRRVGRLRKEWLSAVLSHGQNYRWQCH